MVWHWIVKIVLWTLAGYLAGKLMKDDKPHGWILNIILGLIGGFVGSLIFSLIGLGSRSFIGDVLVSTVGACIVIWLVRKLAK